jgi:hypothetical protein
MIVRTASYIISNSWLLEPARATIGSFGIGKGLCATVPTWLTKNHYFKNWMVFKEMTSPSGDDVFLLQESDSAVSIALCKIKSNIVTKTFRWLEVLFYQSSLGIKDDFLSECFGQVLGLVVFYWESQYCCGLWLMDYGFIIATDYLFVNST